MNAADTIQAAIDKLEAEKLEDRSHALTTDLLHTMYHCVDPVLAILRFGLKRQEAVDWARRLAGDKQVWAASLELDLARAILGES